MGENIYMDYRSGRMADDNGFRLNGISNFLALEEKTYIIPLWITIVGSGISSLAGKIIFTARDRSAIYAENTFSFPSAHSMMAMAFLGSSFIFC